MSVSPWRPLDRDTPSFDPPVEPASDEPFRNRRRPSGRRLEDSCPRSAPRILLIEPHHDRRVLYAMLFEDVGGAVYAVSNGRAAIDVNQQRLPDIVVMEMSSPDSDGFAILQQLRAEPSTADIPAVIVTQAWHCDVPASARQSGATIVVTTPIMADVLLTAVEELLRTTPPERFARRQLRRSLLTLKHLGSALDDGARERVRALIDRLQVAVLAIDAEGHYVAASSGAELLSGFRREELLEMSVSDAVFGPDLPLARSWDAFRARAVDTMHADICDRTGRRLHVATSFVTVVPGLDVAAIVPERNELTFL